MRISGGAALSWRSEEMGLTLLQRQLCKIGKRLPLDYPCGCHPVR